MKKLSVKIWGMTLIFLIIAISFMITVAHFLYEQLYVDNVEQSMIEVGVKLQTNYSGGAVTDELIANIEQFNTYSHFDVFAVRDAKELSACVPFDIDYDALIGSTERQQLLNGETVTKIGYEPRFDRQLISVVIPFTDENRLEGILYMYYPLAKILELTNEDVRILTFAALVFLIGLSFIIYKAVKKLLAPLTTLQQAANDMRNKKYETRVQVKTDDEVGQLARAFNDMAQSIEQEDEAQRTFLATVSHELRTPISYVKGYSEAIEQGYIDEQKIPETIHLIAREANRMQRITNDLLTLARNEKSEKLELMPIVLEECIRESVLLLEQQLNEKQITLQLQVEDEWIVAGDEQKLKQVFINVFENAITYSKQNERIKLMISKHGKYAHVQIQDFGIGISPKDLPHITDRFYRVNKARSRADGGSGLGLSIVSQIIEQHQGKLMIESKLNQGTSVHVYIPIWEEDI
jgi:signal transduction histidine kinase